MTDSFEVKTEPREVCLLSSLSFLLSIDLVVDKTTKRQGNDNKQTFSSQLDDIDLADDTGFLPHNLLTLRLVLGKQGKPLCRASNLTKRTKLRT